MKTVIVEEKGTGKIRAIEFFKLPQTVAVVPVWIPIPKDGGSKTDKTDKIFKKVQKGWKYWYKKTCRQFEHNNFTELPVRPLNASRCIYPRANYFK